MKYLLGLLLWVGIVSFSFAQTSTQEEGADPNNGTGLSCFMVDEENIVCFANPDGGQGFEFAPEEPSDLNNDKREKSTPFDDEDAIQKEQPILRDDNDGKVRVLL